VATHFTCSNRIDKATLCLYLLDTFHSNRLGRILRLRAITAPGRHHLALLRRRADTSATATETCPTALGLALIVLEHEQRVGARNELVAQQLLIGGSVSPFGDGIACRKLDAIIRPHRGIRLIRPRRILQEIRLKPLRLCWGLRRNWRPGVIRHRWHRNRDIRLKSLGHSDIFAIVCRHENTGHNQ